MTVKPLWIVPRSTNNLPLAVGGGGGSTDTINAVTVNVSGQTTTSQFRVGGDVKDTQNLTQGVHLGWNPAGDGLAQIINKRGLGSGGFSFVQSNGDGSSYATGKKELFRINDGSVVVPEALTVGGVFRRTPAVMARRMTFGTLINENQDTSINFGSSDGMNVNSGNTGLTYSAPNFTNTSGVTQTYMVTYTVGFAFSTNGTHRLSWIGVGGNNNDKRYGQSVQMPILATNTGTLLTGSSIIVLNNNEFFSIWCWHNSPGTLGIGGSIAGNDHSCRILITTM